jgi:hypothetical protein
LLTLSVVSGFAPVAASMRAASSGGLGALAVAGAADAGSAGGVGSTRGASAATGAEVIAGGIGDTAAGGGSPPQATPDARNAMSTE